HWRLTVSRNCVLNCVLEIPWFRRINSIEGSLHLNWKATGEVSAAFGMRIKHTQDISRAVSRRKKKKLLIFWKMHRHHSCFHLLSLATDSRERFGTSAGSYFAPA